MTNRLDLTGQGEGERLHAQRRRRFWLVLGGLALLGAVGGFLGGFVSSVADARQTTLDPLYASIGVAGVVLFAITVVIASWQFFASVDELEVADNLWGSLIGFYAYVIMLPLWWAMHKLGQAPEPDQWVIYGAAVTISLVGYAARKWLNR